jgi:hypothetical protein
MQEAVVYRIADCVISTTGGPAVEVSGIGSTWEIDACWLGAAGENLQGVVRTEGANTIGKLILSSSSVNAIQARHAVQVNGYPIITGGFIGGHPSRELVWVDPYWKGYITGTVAQYCPAGTWYGVATSNVEVGRIFELACER